jgi:hypothetical protein
MQIGTAGLLSIGTVALGVFAGSVLLKPHGDALPGGVRCTAAAKPMARLELLFGTSRYNADPVGEQDWKAFVDTEITPRFPDGLTLFEGSGQWRGADGVLKRERSHMLTVWYEATSQSDTNIEAIRSAYKTRFKQESVMRVDSRSCVSF